MEYEFSEEEAIAEYINFLVEEGGLVLNGVNEDGEIVYKPNWEILDVIAPEYAAVARRSIEDIAISLYEKGLVDIKISDEGEVLYYAIDKSIMDNFQEGMTQDTPPM